MKSSVRTFTAEDLKKVMDIINNRMETEAPKAKVAAATQHKTGDIPRWNLPPLETCGGNCAACAKHCYALKDYMDYRVAVVSKSHARNLLAVKDDLGKVEAYLVKWIQRHEPAFFRIHASGDFAVKGMELDYALMWYRVARECPKTRFLAFTKCYGIALNVPFYELDNFSLVLSEWTDVLEAPAELKEHYATSRAVEELEDARPDEMICPGNCETCGACWSLAKMGKNVAFEIH